MKPVKVAILSCNHGHAKGYFGLQDDPFFELVGVSVTPGYTEKLDTIPDIPKYETDEDLYLNHPDLEAVIIASDNKSHMRQVRDATKRGLHIFSMKIPTFNMDEYREMIELTERAGLVFQIELEMRHHAPLYRIKEIVESCQIGELLSINMVNYSHNPVWWRPWQCDPEDSYGKRMRLRPGDNRFRGGALADHPHIFDAIRFITDLSFDTVFADVSPNLRPDVETEDMVRVIGRLSNGTIYSIDPSYANNEHRVPIQVEWEKYPRCVEVFMTAVGSKGIVLADLYGKTYYSQRGAAGEYMCNSVGSEGLWNRRTQEFYECIREGARPPVGLHEHLETIVAMNAAYESISTGKVVKMDYPLL
jgi:predicted dehydrogenase